MFVAVAATVLVCSVDQPKFAHCVVLCAFFLLLFSLVYGVHWNARETK